MRMSFDAVKIRLRGFLDGCESHPGRSLSDHLELVAERARILGERMGCLGKEDLEKLYLAGLTHDVGKAGRSWQHYLRNGGPKVPHSELSSYVTMDMTQDLFLTEIVRRHHGSLGDINEAASIWAEMTWSHFRDRIREILPEHLPMDEKSFEALADKIALSGPNFSALDWIRLRSMLSCLITADRMDAMGAQVQVREKAEVPFNIQVFDRRHPLAAWREDIRTLCLRKAAELGEPRVYTLTLPTGAGKTNLGLEIAWKWAESKGYMSIIYVLPFISVTQQNAAIAREMFGRENVLEDHSMVAALGEDGMNNTDNVEKSADSFCELFRYWHLPVVVTTMAHLWHVLYGNRVNLSMNFHRLAKSVVILDEPQAMRPSLWSGFGKTLDLLAKELKSAFVLMTATQPRMTESALEIADKVATKPFKSRYRCSFVKESICVDELSDFIRRKGFLERDSGLVLVNTRKGALKVFLRLRQLLGDEIFFLSTWMTPVHRECVIKELRRRELEKSRRFLVSTQVVEAGVDLDFDWVIRDLAPFDSIIQAAGRCNRHGVKSMGEVLVIPMKDVGDSEKLLSSMVYDPVSLDIMKAVSSKFTGFYEQEAEKAIDEYYASIMEKIRNEDLWIKLKQGKFDSLPELYNEDKKIPALIRLIIEDTAGSVSSLIKTYKETKRSLENFLDRHRLIREIFRRSIEVPEREIMNWRNVFASRSYEEGGDFPLRFEESLNSYILSCRGTTDVYDSVCGFMPKSLSSQDEDDWIFI